MKLVSLEICHSGYPQGILPDFIGKPIAKFVGNKRRASVGRAELQVYNLKTKHPQLIGREIYWFIHSVCNGFGGNENLFYPKGNAAIPSQKKVGHQLLRINRQKYLEIL